ncbi:MAG: restriction endonuclease subunit S [Firmicutes bacterium]|nr:restriction endonuclease subunit S [Bacillota bacterium]
MREYPEYKPSNLPWLGDIPSHWEVWKVTHGFNRIGSGTTPKSDNPLFYDGTIPWITTSELREDTILDTSQRVTKEAVALHSALKVYPQGSLAIAMYGATIGRLGILGMDATVNQACCVFSEPTVFDTRFVYYWLWMRRPVLISLSTGGGQPNLSQDDLKKLWIPIPSIGEQRAIVRFLDHKTAQIDALIAKKQSLLDKLTEQRLALITQAVTKGLDPTVATRDAGAAWLGKIPAHWSTSRVKFVAKVGNGSTPSRDNPEYWFDGDFPWLNSSVVNREVVDSADQFVTGVALKECHLPIIEPPAVLVGITGQGKTRGMSSKLTFRATINQHLVYVKPYGDSINVDYLHHIFERAYAYLRNESDAGGSTKGAITCSQIENLAIPLPPLAEQEQIVRFVDKDYSRISRLQKKVKAALQRLQEYRAALITNTVTGKIDVRDFCIPTTTEQREVAHG